VLFFPGLLLGWLVGVRLAYLADRRLHPGGGRELPLWAASVDATVAAVAVPAAGWEDLRCRCARRVWMEATA
jgi:hypothetical protein